MFNVVVPPLTRNSPVPVIAVPGSKPTVLFNTNNLPAGRCKVPEFVSALLNCHVPAFTFNVPALVMDGAPKTVFQVPDPE